MSSIFADRFPGQKARPAAGTPFSWYVSGIVLAAGLGAAAALGDIDSKRGVVILILAFGVTGGLVLAFAPIRLVVGIFLFLTFVVVGPLVSIARFDQARWIPYLFALVLLLRVPMEWYHTSKTGGRSGFRRDKTISPVAGAIGWYFVLVLISVLTNLPPPTQVLVGAKAYLFIWGFFFLLAACSISPEMLQRIWKSVLIVAIVQAPFALYQRFFEASRRQAGGLGMMLLWELSRALKAAALAVRWPSFACSQRRWRYPCVAASLSVLVSLRWLLLLAWCHSDLEKRRLSWFFSPSRFL
jgi:hypothetical protein